MIMEFMSEKDCNTFVTSSTWTSTVSTITPLMITLPTFLQMRTMSMINMPMLPPQKVVILMDFKPETMMKGTDLLRSMLSDCMK